MLGETVISIIETAASSGGGTSGMGLLTRVLAMSPAEYAAFAAHNNASFFFRSIPIRTAAWVKRIQYLRRMQELSYLANLAKMYSGDFAFSSAVAKIAAEEAMIGHAAQIAAADAAAVAAKGTLLTGTGTIVIVAVLPVVAMVAVATALGAPYYQAREEAKKEEYASGFSRGFITGLLKWEVRFAIDRFWDNGIGKNGFDESMPAIRAAAHNEGLLKGRIAGLAKNEGEKKSYLKGLAKVAKASSDGWTARSDDPAEKMRARRVQVGYVVDLAAAARKHKIIDVE
jgi:hypothetical protein